jgi:hypothetical protein
MKHTLRQLCLTTLLGCLAAFSQLRTARAAEDNGPGPGERLQRVERRLNELAERQEQILRRLGAQDDRQGHPGPQMNAQNPPQAGPMQSPWGSVGPNPGANFGPHPGPFRRPWLQGRMAPDGARDQKPLRDFLGLIFLAGMICNILLAVWIFTDIRKRGEGSGIFIALALVAGIPTALIYALVRIGDKKP